MAASITTWVTIIGAILALMKQGQDLRTSNLTLANSMATVVKDGTEYEKRLARLERRLQRLEGKPSRAGLSAAQAAPDTVRRPAGLMTLVGRAGAGLWRFIWS